MKKILLTYILFTISYFAFSQQKELYYEDFNTIYSSWIDVPNDKKLSYIENGNLNIKNEKSNIYRLFSSQININFNKNFSIETKIKQIKGSTNKGYGLAWGSKGINNSYVFLVSSNGNFCVGKYVDNEYFSIAKWKKSSSIKPIKNYNLLKISREGNFLKFYINNEKVYETAFENFFGQLHGFFIQGNIACSIDFLKITDIRDEIDYAAGKFKGKKENIGTKINSSATDIAPIISADGNTLYFARGSHKGNYAGLRDEADIWYSNRKADGTWTKAKNIGAPLNNSGVNVVVNAMPDGNTLFLEGLYNSDGSFKSDQGISVTHRTKSGWSVPKQVVIKDFYNKNQFETYFFTSDQKILIMSIERDDSYGEKDLYISFRQNDGTYSKPQNLGQTLNTIYDEGTPFMAPDNRTLYFSSDGHKGFGSSDIFVTKRLDDSWLNWSKPKNMGKSINTNDWDTYLSTSAKGDMAFLVSTSNSFGLEDIFIIELQQDAKPEPVVIIKGKVLDEKTKTPISAKITYRDLANGKEVGIARSDPRSGDYQIVLPYGKLYGFRAEAENYIAQNENINLTKTSDYKEITQNLYLMKIKVGKIIKLNNVFFEQASDEIIKTSYEELDRIVKILEDNPKMRIELLGHTDNRGNPEKLMKLSEKRVLRIKEYFVKKGIDENRIEHKAYGGTQPINKNNSEEEHSKNRRVEFKILNLK